MTMLDSCADFLSEFHCAVRGFAREVHNYSDPDYLEANGYSDKLDAMRSACRKVIVSYDDDGDRPFDFEAAAELIRLAATLHEDPEAG
jgi:hypothetical protein